MRMIKTVVMLALFAVVGVAVLLGLLWLDDTRETTLPTPTGPFAVGRVTYVWSDPTHSDPRRREPNGSFLPGFGIRSASTTITDG
jgi:hypothetical protein